MECGYARNAAVEEEIMKFKILNKLGSVISELELDLDKIDVIYEDKFGRKWKLEQINNPAVELPFLVKLLLAKEKE